MKIDSDPLQVGDASYGEPMAINMVEITEDFNMTEFENSENHIEVVFPKHDERLVKFLHRCKAEDLEVMLCPRCNAVFDKKAIKKDKSAQQEKKQDNWRKNMSQFYFDKRGIPQKKEVVEFIYDCLTCHKSKIEHQKSYGLMQPLNILKWK